MCNVMPYINIEIKTSEMHGIVGVSVGRVQAHLIFMVYVCKAHNVIRQSIQLMLQHCQAQLHVVYHTYVVMASYTAKYLTLSKAFHWLWEWPIHSRALALTNSRSPIHLLHLTYSTLVHVDVYTYMYIHVIIQAKLQPHVHVLISAWTVCLCVCANVQARPTDTLHCTSYKYCTCTYVRKYVFCAHSLYT